jgi:hypothetical protein
MMEAASLFLSLAAFAVSVFTLRWTRARQDRGVPTMRVAEMSGALTRAASGKVAEDVGN